MTATPQNWPCHTGVLTSCVRRGEDPIRAPGTHHLCDPQSSYGWPHRDVPARMALPSQGNIYLNGLNKLFLVLRIGSLLVL